MAPRFLLSNTLLALCLVAGPAAQDQGRPAPTPAELSQRWEDVLLLDAVRHLKMSPGQLQRTTPLADTAAHRLGQVAERNRSSSEKLSKLLARHRTALLKGSRTSTVEQEQALLLRKGLADEQARAADELVLFLTPRFARVLLGEQSSRAFRLTNGEWPEGIDRSPALLERESGFVLDRPQRAAWQEAALRGALSGRYPESLLQQLARAPQYRAATMDVVKLTYARTFEKSLELGLAAPAPKANPQDPAREGRRAAAGAEKDAFQKDPERLARQWAESAAPAELPDFLRQLAQRLFLSPRFRTILADRLGKPRPEDPKVDRDQVLLRDWEDALLLNAVRYLQLSPEQMEQLLALAETSEQRLGKLDAQLTLSNRRLLDETDRFRESLLHGRPLPSREQQAVLDFNSTLREQRIQARPQLVNEMTQQLAGLLDRSQVARVYLLFQGLWPRDEAKAPMLLATDSGFAWQASAQDDRRRRALRKVLAQGYPEDVVDEVAGPRISGSIRTLKLMDSGNGVTFLLDGAVESKPLPLAVKVRPPAAQGRQPQAPADPVRDAATRDLEALRQRWNQLGQLLEGGATPREIELALRPIVRRLFLSPRFPPVLQERLQYPEGPEEALAPAPDR